MRSAFFLLAAAIALSPAAAKASAAAREIVCYAGAAVIYRGKNDPSRPMYYRGSAVTFVDAADGRWKTFPLCSMVWEAAP